MKDENSPPTASKLFNVKQKVHPVCLFPSKLLMKHLKSLILSTASLNHDIYEYLKPFPCSPSLKARVALLPYFMKTEEPPKPNLFIGTEKY